MCDGSECICKENGETCSDDAQCCSFNCDTGGTGDCEPANDVQPGKFLVARQITTDGLSGG